MTLSTKILLIVGGVLLISIMGFIAFQQVQNANKLAAIETQVVAQKQLVDGLVRSQSTWATKADMDKFMSDNNVNLKAIQADLDTLNGQITAVNVAVASSVPQKVNNVPTTSKGPTNPNPVDPSNPDPYGFSKAQQNLVLNEDFGTIKVPVGEVGFSAWQKDPWSVDIKARQYTSSTVIGTDENQRVYVYNKFAVKVDDKTYSVPIQTANTVQEYPEAKFSWFNPRLFLTTGGSADVSSLPISGSFNIGSTIQIMSYGKYKTNPDISVLQIGAGYESNKNEFAAIVNPVSFNIGSIIPGGIVNNTFIGPSTQLSANGNILVGANASVGF